MLQTEIGWRMSLSLLDQKLGRKQKGSALRHLPSLRTRVGAQVALQRCPILHTSVMSVPCFFINPLPRGHFYFGNQGTFLLWVDRAILLSEVSLLSPAEQIVEWSLQGMRLPSALLE
jgi:hypothetical protein